MMLVTLELFVFDCRSYSASDSHGQCCCIPLKQLEALTQAQDIVTGLSTLSTCIRKFVESYERAVQSPCLEYKAIV